MGNFMTGNRKANKKRLFFNNRSPAPISVRTAAKKLLVNDLARGDWMNYMGVLANFRSEHVRPMQSMIVNIRKKAFEIDKKAIVVQRLKRIPSIINKLKRFRSMQVSTMGDIGGIRVILNNIRQVERLAQALKNSRTRNKLLSTKDYISNPKESGYRSIHLTYSYQGQKRNYKDLRVEIQIRSLIQHSWATAVEVVGTFSQQNLKASYGDKQWLDFFKDASKAFIYLEDKQPVPENLQSKINAKMNELKVKETLLSYTIAAHESDKKEGYYLLKLDIEKKEIYAKYITPKFLFDGYEEYRRIEQEISENEKQDVVLVSASSLKDLKKAYPNYFADTLFFLRNLEKAFNAS